jgi:hypothetical protein
MKIKKDLYFNDLHYLTKRTYDLFYDEANKKSYKYLKKYINKAIFCEQGWWNISLNKINKKGLCLEFGVYKGESLNYFSNYLPERHWYGFDSFLGLQEDWKGGWFEKGHFNLKNNIPKFNKNVTLIQGWFKETLSKFLNKHKETISFIHIDCDTYESTKDIFKVLKKESLQDGCIILFDEYFGYINWENNEFKAWKEYVKKNKIKYEYVAFGERQAVIKILK